MAKKPVQPAPQSREWTSSEEIERGIQKLQRRIAELDALDVTDSTKSDVAVSNFRDAIRDVFGADSPEFLEQGYAQMWHGAMYGDMPDHEIREAKESGRKYLQGTLEGLIGRLREKQADLGTSGSPTPTAFLAYLNLHPRIAEVANDLFTDGYPWEAVFAASKALVNFVKEKSGRHDLDGAPLVRTVFSKNNPLLVFNELKDQTDTDEQEGMMHLFEGVVLGIRNPGGHSFPEGPEQRAVEYLSLISLLAYRVQESKRRRTT